MSMVACLGCRKIVWAYDHERRPLAGILNMLKMPCPKCGQVANFDGWDGASVPTWLDMHTLAEHQGFDWEPDEYNRWFGGHTGTIGRLVAGDLAAVPADRKEGIL